MSKTRFNIINITRKPFNPNRYYQEIPLSDSSENSTTNTPYLPVNTKNTHSFIVDWQIQDLHLTEDDWP
ncbi:MAG: hypothetical protein WAO52_19745 [Prolixibacteraceae bacterium]